MIKKITSITLTIALLISTISIIPVTSHAQEFIEEETMTTYYDAMKVNLDNVSTVNAYFVDSNAAKYDPRPYGRVTSVKNQGQEGMCWDYAVQAAAESSLIASGQANNSIDLSESYYAYNLFQQSHNTNITFAQFYNGGYARVSQSLNDNKTLNSFALESDFPMPSKTNDAGQTVPDTDKLSAYTLTDTQLQNYKYIVNRSYYIENYNTSVECRNKIKQLIAKFGGTTFNFYSNEDYMNNKSTDTTKDISYYCPNIKSTSHAVEIIGWDDNYSASNFKTTPAGNGAWLIKNSWGVGAQAVYQYGNYSIPYDYSTTGSGFMWISYYNDSIGDMICAMELVPKGTATYETKSITMSGNETLDLTKVNKEATWNGYTNKTFKPISFDTTTLKAYDEWNNLLGKYEVTINPSTNATLNINQWVSGKGNVDIDNIIETTNYPTSISRLDLRSNIDGITVYPTYTSTNEEVAVITNNTLTFNGFGTTTITGTVNLKGKTYTDSFKVTVNKEGVTGIYTSCSSLYVSKGETYKITEIYTTPCNDELTYTSSDNNIVGVDANGVITRYNNGLAIITVTPKSNPNINVQLEIYEPYTGEEFTTPIIQTPQVTIPTTNPNTTVTPTTSTTQKAVTNTNKVIGVNKATVKATGKKKAIKLTMSAGGADYFEIKVSTSKNFTKKTTKEYDTYDDFKNTLTIKKLKSGTTYYVKVRGVNDDCNGKWSKVIKVKTKKK